MRHPELLHGQVLEVVDENTLKVRMKDGRIVNVSARYCSGDPEKYVGEFYSFKATDVKYSSDTEYGVGEIKNHNSTKFMEKQTPEQASLSYVMTVLKSHGIEMNVYACDCCNSPEIEVWHNGKKINDTVSHTFTMRKDDE